MKNFRYLILLATLPLFLISCDNAGSQSSKTGNLIKGTITNYAGQQIILERVNPNSIDTKDTLEIEEDGSFSLYPNVDFASFYRLTESPSNFCVFVLEPGDTISISAEATDLEKSYEIENSPQSEMLQVLNTLMANYSKSNDSLQKLSQQAQQAMNYQMLENLYQAQQGLNMRVGSQIQRLVLEDPSSFVAMSAVQNFDPNRDYKLYSQVEEAWLKVRPESPYVKDLTFKLDKFRKVQVGAEAPNITLMNPNGEELSLFDLRGKVVLIDFWASWCKPCRAENPNVVRAYNKFKDKGFEIFGVSLDQEKAKWLAAIENDGLTWPQVSDLKGWQSEGAAIYNVQSIPAAFLIDAEGKIIARDLRGEALERKLSEVLGS